MICGHKSNLQFVGKRKKIIFGSNKICGPEFLSKRIWATKGLCKKQVRGTDRCVNADLEERGAATA